MTSSFRASIKRVLPAGEPDVVRLRPNILKPHKGLSDKSLVIAVVCEALTSNATDAAVSILKRDYPFAPESIIKRQYGAKESTRVFIRDGFLDRYTSERLVFPPVLRILSGILPAAFPFHTNWKTDVTHPSYWEIGATVDHFIPVSRGGADDETNWVTTSMARNSAKMNWTLEELGWELQPPGDFKNWDGLMGWFLTYTDSHPEAVANSSIKQWRGAAKLALAAV